MIIEGFFSNIKSANETVGKLKQNGYEKAFVDINEHYNKDRNVKTNLAGTEASQSLSGLVLDSDAHGPGEDRAPLYAASPLVSGIGRFNEIADVKCKVVVDTSGKDDNRARQILAESGGELQNPNIKKPDVSQDRSDMLLGKIFNRAGKNL